MLLELEEYKDFLEEVSKGDIVRIAVFNDEKDGNVLTRAVFTIKKPDHVVRFIEEFPARRMDDKEAEASLKKAFEEKRTDIASREAGFTKGMWSL